ncbi:hypothetical protein [Deinococcus sp. QL22]|uniref:hypothetical protein n=1 Tax=Deinococcus sp. QL22 TaxID=2939437 RepID=UPI002017CCEE|nr:hypothetical protein [Deinococcus sp. QL22]UQN04872.1 hypothetical protein M1R55_08020 [Deinococcus sp. QL22]
MDQLPKVGRHAPRLQDWDEVDAAPPEPVVAETAPPKDTPAAPESPEQALARKRLAQGFWTLPGEAAPVAKPAPNRLVWLMLAVALVVGVTVWAVLR